MKLYKQLTGPGGRIADYSHLLFARVQVAQSFQLSIIFVSTERWGATRFEDIDRVRRAAAFLKVNGQRAISDKPKSGSRRGRRGGVA